MRRIAIALPLAALFAATALAAAPGTGTGGNGDPFFPGDGNGGYRVSHYGVDLDYAHAANRLAGRVTVSARATQRLTRFNLDFRGPPVLSVEVDGKRAKFEFRKPELIVRPAKDLANDKKFEVTVRYGGTPRPVIDPDGSREGWIRTDDGAFVVGEPLGTTAWIPSNNTPRDKARFTISVTVPGALKGVSNGRLAKVKRNRATKTFTWKVRQPMATYLAVLDIGRGELKRFRAAGVPAWTFVDPREQPEAGEALKSIGSVIRSQEKIFGPYPFDATGSIVDHDAGVGYALETQTRPIYDGAPDATTLVHEQAHMWFGDSVTPTTWPQIWLNEGFATWAEWYYSETHDGSSAATIFRRFYAEPASSEIWNPPPGNPRKPANLFAASIYVRGAMGLQAMRETVGTKDFLTILRRWATSKRYGNGTIAQFTALAEKVSGKKLGALQKRWLFEPGKPPGGPLGDGATRSAASAPRLNPDLR